MQKIILTVVAFALGWATCITQGLLASKGFTKTKIQGGNIPEDYRWTNEPL